MTATLRHQLKEDDRVLIVAVSDTPRTFHVTAQEAKRFAWSLLADLEPEDAAEAGYMPPPAPEDHAYAHRDEYEPGGWQKNAILRALALGFTTSHAIAREINTPVRTVQVQLSNLKRKGRVVQVTKGRSCHPGEWRLA